VTVLGISNPAAPIELTDIDDLSELNAESVRRARQGRENLEAFIAPFVEKAKSDLTATFEEIIADVEVDSEMFRQRELRAIFVEAVTEALANGPEGWYADAWYLNTPWDFALEEVAVPVYIWYSEKDQSAPPRSVELMAKRLNVASIDLRSGGHLGDAERQENVWRTLVAAA
jgi:pimeloyl-ACP methyl ester carboxylesterase